MPIMDGLSFHKTINIINKRYLGSSINRVSLLGGQLYISIFAKSQLTLLFNTNPPALELVETALGESAAVLANLSGARLVTAGDRPYDRLGWLMLEKRRPSGKLMTYKLVLEPMGNYSNAFLLGEDGTILFRISGKNIDADRDIGVGKVYTEPRANKRYSLDKPADTSDFNDLVGFYPLTAAIANRYRDEIGYEQAIELIKQELSSDSFYLTEKGKIVPFTPFEGASRLSFEDISWSKSATSKTPTEPDAKLSESLRKFYTKQLEHYQKLATKLECELVDAIKYPEMNAEADLIKSNLHIIKGVGEYNLTQYDDTGMQERIYTYNADIAPAAYADKLYKRAAKLKRAVPLLQERLEQTRQLIESAEEQLYYVANADIYALKELAELLKRDKASKQAKGEASFWEYHWGDATIYIGRNSASNHRLVFQFAQAGDMWLHAQKIPSAHCIIRSTAPHLSDELLTFAARLTAAHSKNKHEQKVPVDYTLKKHVRKPRNTPTGFVIYDHFKTLLVQPFTEAELSQDERSD